MFQTLKKTAAFTIILSLSAQAMAFTQRGHFGDLVKEATFEIKVENLTQGQTLTPPLVVIGDEIVFKVGEPSSRALSFLAEDGHLSVFKEPKRFENALFSSEGIEPGKTKTYEITAKFKNLNFAGHYTFSLASMLASTNDAFVGLDREELRGGFGSVFAVGISRTFDAKVYDAGTERNTESCEHIPGPPCGSHNVRADKGAEGVVSRHPGLSLVGSDLGHSELFPTIGARITVTRTK